MAGTLEGCGWRGGELNVKKVQACRELQNLWEPGLPAI